MKPSPLDPTSPRALEPLLTTKDLQRLLGLSDRSIRRLTTAGELPGPIMVGKSRRWRMAEIRKYLNFGLLSDHQ